ncbi:MAG: DNA mismatch repair endonuclease MutL [Rickettsiales bacterium]|jgi:DNA mismatch repair protein MutL|nr:DNA mismatch repair endonuclease MutL [Rickettsiales bacterium]
MSVRILPDNLVNIIAAGEVVERPSSVVKELVENALDAGATEIEIDVKDGGRTLIQVSDNGAGMAREDLEKSILRHATSKLPDDDLLNISFMGFRGEALPSIASVSELSIETNGLSLDASSMKIKPSPREKGTCVRVRNLFQRIPARLKFLRSDRVEMMSVSDAVNRLALARPDVGFSFNNKIRHEASEPLISRFGRIAGADADGNMLEIDADDGDIRLSGFVSVPTLRRASGIDQYLFVNRRPVKDKVLVGALRAAYFDVMHAREFPLCCLYLEMPPNQVDVNVSPAKTEVHFLEPARIRDFIVRTIRRALAATAVSQGLGNNELEVPGGADKPASYFSDYWVGSGALRIDADSAFSAPDGIAPLPDMPLGYARAQIGNKYILAENPDGLIIVDQHAAHERIVYENLRKGDVRRQPLLIPEVIKMKPEQAAAILEIKAELSESGLALESFGDSEIAIYEKPADFDLDWGQCLSDVADEVLANGHSSVVKERLHLKLANHACHHSVRAGQKLSLEQMNALLREIEGTERGGECNHGRPVWKKFSFDELDGKFERS